MMGPDLMNPTKRFNLIHELRISLSRFLCKWISHKGDIVGSGHFILIDKKNKNAQYSKDIFLKRKCQRYGCSEYYTTLKDRIGVEKLK